MIAFLMFVENTELTSCIVSGTKILLASSVSSGEYVFNTRNLQVKKKAVDNGKASVKVSR